MTMTSQDIHNFRTYFNIADELSDGEYKVEDLDLTARREARFAATDFGLSWPPDLAEAEEFYAAHYDEINS
jgi:hypothetical protein